MTGSYASGICGVCLLSFAPTRARNLRNHGPIDHRCCGLSKQPAQPRPQDDAHLLSQSATSIGHVVDSATVVLDAVPIPPASTGNHCYYRCKSQAQLYLSLMYICRVSPLPPLATWRIVLQWYWTFHLYQLPLQAF